MENSSFYRLKFIAIDLVINYWFSGQPLTWWLMADLLAEQKIIANIRIWENGIHESCGYLSQHFRKKKEKRMSFVWLLELKI